MVTVHEQQAAPEQADLRQRIAQALRDAAHDCDGDCGLAEEQCFEQHPIQVSVLHFDQIAGVYGYIDALAEVAAAAARAELAALREQLDARPGCPDPIECGHEAEVGQLREQAERYQLGTLERAALLEEARDALEAAGQNGAHGDDWPAIAPAIRALAAENERLRALLAHDHHLAYHQGEPRDGLLWHCGRDHCTAPNDQPPTTQEP